MNGTRGRIHIQPQLRIVAGLLVLLAVTLACSLAGSQAAPTNTPPPSDTPAPASTDTPQPTATLQPTETPIPTDTPQPTNIPSPTPNRTATAQFKATQTAQALEAGIKELLPDYGLSPDEGHLGWFSDHPLLLTVSSHLENSAVLLDPDLIASDFVFQTDVSWDTTGGLAGCGMIFKAEDDLEWGAYYELFAIRLSGFPGWWVSYYNHGQWQSSPTKYIQTSSAINQKQGSTNTFTLVSEGSTTTVYANGDRLRSLTITQRQEGLFGLFASQESGQTTCTFDNVWVWVLK